MTGVEWLIEQIKSNIFCDHIQGVEYWDKDTLIEFLEQAKAIDKEQKIKEMIGLLQWMNKIASETPMRLETDLDDIVE